MVDVGDQECASTLPAATSSRSARATDSYDPAVSRIREARPEEAQLLATVQERASVAALAHIFRPSFYPYPSEAIRARWAEAVGGPGARR